jgi:hypothetical protein
VFWEIHGNLGYSGNQHLNEAIPHRELWESDYVEIWEVYYNFGESWESAPK